MSHQAAVFLKLGLTWPTHAYACLHPAEMGPHPFQAWQGIFQLRQFHLEAGFSGTRPGGKNIQNQFTAIEYFALGGFLQGFDLTGGEVVVEQDNISIARFDQFTQLSHLAGSDVGS